MYVPVKAHLEALGFAVSAEVHRCDIVATRGDDVVVVELKRAFELRLVYQGMARQSLTPLAYLCVPRPRNMRSAACKDMLRLVRRLGLGLMLVAMDSPLRQVDVAVQPDYDGRTDGAKRRRLLAEIAGRAVGQNVGGVTRTKINTAYREQAIRIACAMETFGELSAKQLVRTYGCASGAYRVIYINTYGWFERRGKGLYGLSREGEVFLRTDEQFREVIAHYRRFFAGF